MCFGGRFLVVGWEGVGSGLWWGMLFLVVVGRLIMGILFWDVIVWWDFLNFLHSNYWVDECFAIEGLERRVAELV